MKTTITVAHHDKGCEAFTDTNGNEWYLVAGRVKRLDPGMELHGTVEPVEQGIKEYRRLVFKALYEGEGPTEAAYWYEVTDDELRESVATHIVGIEVFEKKPAPAND